MALVLDRWLSLLVDTMSCEIPSGKKKKEANYLLPST